MDDRDFLKSGGNPAPKLEEPVGNTMSMGALSLLALWTNCPEVVQLGQAL